MPMSVGPEAEDSQTTHDSAPVDDEIDGPPQEPAPLIESRFLFVDVSAMRAKQLRRGARPRVSLSSGDATDSPTQNLERIAMAEVRQRLVYYTLPEPKPAWKTKT